MPVFLRGTTECCVFPLTGYPPTDETDWGRIFEICKNHGLNHMRFHSYCPPEAAFIAADKAGFYLQVEGPSWAKYSTALGYGKPIDQYLMDETKRIIDEYGNHPSFVMMAYGNEPSGRYVGYLENWVDHFRKYDPQRVFTGASTGRSWAIIDNSDFIVRSPPRGLKWKDQQPESVFDYRNNTEGQQRPYVTFEMGQWCAFPNFKEIEKYTGSLKAMNFELFQEELERNHMGELADELLMASGKLQASCYKQEIEATLRTPNLAGFQLLSLNDFSGQGTALVGVLDAFWDEKGYISAKEFSEFCNAVVPLARMNKFTFESDDTLKPLIEVANFSGEV
ncbi:MAG TPA: glycoside hydrolase family 2 TIM barrel-domain containing protein, partial [Prolixibacteraceae bacterium]|nr:glycoside hydrolase family 2 TIM barrel-domain containing protein [Prolixibacteraceae bacterium]